MPADKIEPFQEPARTLEARALAGRIIDETEKAGVLNHQMSVDQHDRQNRWRRTVLNVCFKMLEHTEKLIQGLSDVRHEIIMGYVNVMRPPIYIFPHRCPHCKQELRIGDFPHIPTGAAPLGASVASTTSPVPATESHSDPVQPAPEDNPGCSGEARPPGSDATER